MKNATLVVSQECADETGNIGPITPNVLEPKCLCAEVSVQVHFHLIKIFTRSLFSSRVQHANLSGLQH